MGPAAQTPAATHYVMKHCPNPECPHLQRTGSPPEYLDGIENCADCGSALREGEAPAIPDGPEAILFDSPLVTVATFMDVQTAYFARALVESAGIPVFLRDEYVNLLNITLGYATGGVKLEVPASQAEAAFQLIHSGQAGPPAASVPPAVEPISAEQTGPCPRCKSDKTIPINAYLSSSLFSFLHGLAHKLTGKKSRCRTCDYIW